MNTHLAFAQVFPPACLLSWWHSLLNPKIAIIKLPAVERPQVLKLKKKCYRRTVWCACYKNSSWHPHIALHYLHKAHSFHCMQCSLPLEFNSFAPAHIWLHSQGEKHPLASHLQKGFVIFSWDEVRGTQKSKSRNFQAFKTDLDLIHWQEWSALYVISASPSHHAKVSKRVCNCCRYWKQSSLGFS